MENNENHNPDPDLEKNHQPWDTQEEFLLASAVNRYGLDWDTISMALQSRTNRLATARHCEQKFHDLSRRFAAVPTPRQNGGAAADSDHAPWVEELRMLRLEELRRELQQRDVNILSMTLNLKRLQDDERAKANNAKQDEKPDPEVPGEKRPENDKSAELEAAGPANSEPEVRRLDESTSNTDKQQPTAGEESDRENQSVNESNSTDSRFEVAKTGDGDVKLGPGPLPVHTGPIEPDPSGRKRKPVGEESNNGSYDTAAKVLTCESVPPSEERKAEEDSSELNDSVAHSGEGGTRESSDVQSSASLTRRRRKTQRRQEVSGSGDGELATVKSEPLVGVWELIKGHENISLFERRLENQDSDYKDMVRQHVDLETIQLRLQKGSYSSSTSAFFRDLLLLFTNATVLFPQGSVESQAAQQLHRLVISEMRSHGQAQSDPSPQKSDSLPPNVPPPDKPDFLLSKHNPSAPVLVCRKRSSISAKPSSATLSQKVDPQPVIDKKEKPPPDAKPPVKPSHSETDEEEATKAKEKPVTGARSLRRSNKNLPTSAGNKKPSSNSTTKGGSSTSKSTDTLKPEKSKADLPPDKKRIAAADFLKRIKRNTSTEAPKSGGGGGSSSTGKGGKEQKKIANSAKGEKGKEKASRNSNNDGGSVSVEKRSSKNVENSSQSKRSVGRPPKKAAAAAAESNAVSAKRGRETSGSGGKDNKRPKKRSKK